MPFNTCASTGPTDSLFEALRVALRQSGGIAQGDDLARLLDDYRLGDFVSLPALIAHGDVFGFQFHSSFWIPMFQFDLHDLSLNRGVAPVIAELADVFDGWHLANWFAKPHAGLASRSPADLVGSLPAMALSAACDSHLKEGLAPKNVHSTADVA